MAVKKTDEKIKLQTSSGNLAETDQKIKDTNLDDVLPPIRISGAHKAALGAHFKREKGLTIAAGCRMVLIEYMRQNNII